MRIIPRPYLRILCAFFACFVLGDIAADAIHDASGLCMTESQSSGHDSCPACGCSFHTGSAIPADALSLFTSVADEMGRVFPPQDRPAAGDPPAIDHPPQLS